jgi:DNA-binding GntR family transcriptional regulator
MDRDGDVTIDTRSLVDKIYDYLLGQIIDGEIKYGDTLRIQDLAEQLHVSTMPVREALKRLQNERIVDIKPRSSCKLRIPSKSEVIEIYELREVLELHAITKFQQYFDKSRLEKLHEITESMWGLENEHDAHIRERKSIELDRQFHAEICKLAENNYINNLYRQLSLHLNMTFIHEKTYSQLQEVFYESHATILNCLENNLEEAAECVKKHFDNVWKYLLTSSR